jgi:hypothetical protein
MTDAPCLTPQRGRERVAREQRLARALRDNLRRRKDQTRARAPQAADPAGDTAVGDTAVGDEPAA